ncbi:MAG: oxidoreductase, partial [Ferrovibrio sp.]
MPVPTGEILLTVTGAIGRGNAQDANGRLEARFDRAMLEQIGSSEVATGTPWHAGVVRCEGVPG